MHTAAPHDAERDVLARVLAEAFTFTAEDAAAWIEAARPENARVLVDAGSVLAGLLTLPMGQFFGGRRVPMVGLAAVGVPPDLRGRGLATHLVRDVLTELHGRRVAISALYPSTLPLYRKLGWEIAGARWEVRLDPKLVGVRDRTLPVRKAGTDDVLGIRGVHLDRARLTPGAIDRHPFLWDRVLAPRGQTADGWVVGDDTVEGYLFAQREPRERGHYDLHVTDLAALNATAARRVLTFFADQATLCDKVYWRGHPDDVVLAQLPDRHWGVRQLDPWMLRVVHLEAAIAARGGPAGFQGEVDLDVHDDALEGNAGRWVLAWADGRAEARRGGRGRVRVDVRGLAALFTGHKAPEQLAAAGLLDGDERSRALLGAAFAGPMPTMWDGF